MAVQMGLEPTISSVTGRHVNHYTTGPNYLFNGADEGNRTPVSALARLCSTIKLHLQNGGPDGTRTHDLLRDREAC